MNKLAVTIFFAAGWLVVVNVSTNVVSFPLHGATATPQAQDGEQTDILKIKHWVKQLGSESFRERELAALKLRQGGLPAVNALLRAATSTDLEVRLRTLKLLALLLKTHNPPDKNVSNGTLELLAREEAPSTYKWALKALAKRQRQNDEATKPTDVSRILEKLAKNKRKEIAKIALGILYPLPLDDDTLRLVKRIVLWEQKIRRCQRQIAEITTGANKNRQGEIQVRNLTADQRRLEQELAGYCEAPLLRHRIKFTKENRGNQVDAATLTQRHLFTTEYSTSRVLIAVAIAKKEIQERHRKIEKLKKTDLSEAARKFYVNVEQNSIQYLQEYVHYFEAEVKDRRK